MALKFNNFIASEYNVPQRTFDISEYIIPDATEVLTTRAYNNNIIEAIKSPSEHDVGLDYSSDSSECRTLLAFSINLVLIKRRMSLQKNFSLNKYARYSVEVYMY